MFVQCFPMEPPYFPTVVGTKVKQSTHSHWFGFCLVQSGGLNLSFPSLTQVKPGLN